MPTHLYPVPVAGIYVPAITFFDPDTDTIALDAQAKYFRYLASTGIDGLIVLGSNAESFLLTREERTTLLKLARASVPADFVIIAGVSGHSTSQVRENIADAYEAGSNYALILPCAYFGKQTTNAVVKQFFFRIAEASTLPIIIYNFPAVSNGLDLDSEIITQIANASPNIVGVKLTCGSVAKITRLAATFPPSRFAVFGGQADFLVGGMAAGSTGCITAFGNVFPRSIVRMYQLYVRGQYKEALRLQQKAALAESPTKAGIANTKYAAAIFTARRAGIKDATRLAAPRCPYQGPDEAARAWIESTMRSMDTEEDLPAVGVREVRL